jgi:hypothetical protein
MDHSDRIRNACRSLRRRRGVVDISYGLWTENGVVTDTPVLRVSIERKAWAEGFGRALPAKLHGMRIEVGPACDVRPLCSCPYRPGEKITRYVPANPVASGSIGCFLQRSSKKFLLTNQHVFLRTSGYNAQKRNEVIGAIGGGSAFDDDEKLPDMPGVQDMRLQNADKVFQPERSDCIGLECNDPLALIKAIDDKNMRLKLHDVGARKFWLDAAVAEIQTGRNISNDIKDIGVINTAIRDLGAEAIESATPPQVAVQKRGFITEATKGTIRDFFHEVTVDGNPTRIFEFAVLPTPDSQFDYDETFTLDDAEPRSNQQIKDILESGSVKVEILSAQNPRKIRVHGKIFSNRGDSGSLIVDAAKRPVGLLWGGNGVDVKVKGKEAPEFLPSGVAIACYIKPVLDALDFKNPDAIVSGSIKTSGPGMPPPEPPISEAFEDAERRLAASERGRALIAAIGAHGEEMRALVLRGGRVSAVWRRYRGPGFVAAALAAARDPTRRLESEIAGTSVETFVEKMHRAIMNEASDGLRSALAGHIDLIFDVVRQARTFSDVVRIVEQPITIAAE